MSKAELIRAGVVHAPGTAPVMEDVELALPRDTEVLIRIESSGVCHTDVAYAAGEFFPEFPVVLGHEIAGIVEAIGARVDRVRLGDRVVFTVDRHCGVCRHCLAGHPVLCQSGIDVEQPPRLRLRGDAVVHGMGGFAEATVLDQRSLTRVPHDVSADVAAVVGCAVTSGAGAVFNVARPRPGESVTVVGLGGVGLSAVMGAAVVGAHPIIAVDPDATRRALALEVGAHIAVPPSRDEIERSLPGGSDVVIESAGTVDAMTFALELTSRGGRMVLMGAPPPGTRLPVDVHELLLGQRQLLTCLAGDIVPERDYQLLFRLYLSGQLDLDRLVTGHVDLLDLGAGFEECRLHRGIRTLVHP